jgi:SAM-dependent methyltransferase
MVMKKMMNNFKEDNTKTIEYFSDRVSRFGNSYKSVDWGSQDSQLLRFKILSEIGNLKDCRLLDVGCGLGDFYGWLTQNKIDCFYKGIDLTPGMIKIANDSYPEAEFVILNILEDDNIPDSSFDYVFASGLFYLRKRESYLYVEQMIAKLFSKGSKGLAVNFLSAWSSLFIEKNEFYADPNRIMSICQSFTQNIVIRHEYHPADFTVYLFK